MKLRDKILYMSFGAGLVVLGMVLNAVIDDADAQNKVSDEISAKWKREIELDKLRFRMVSESDEVLVVKKIVCEDVIIGGISVRGTTFEKGENGGIKQTSEEVVSIRGSYSHMGGTEKSVEATERLNLLENVEYHWVVEKIKVIFNFVMDMGE